MCLYPHMAAHHCGETERREHVILLLIYPFRLAYKINQKTLSRARKGLRELQTIKGTDSQEEGCFRRGRADNSVTLDMLSHFFLTKMFFFTLSQTHSPTDQKNLPDLSLVTLTLYVAERLWTFARVKLVEHSQTNKPYSLTGPENFRQISVCTTVLRQQLTKTNNDE